MSKGRMEKLGIDREGKGAFWGRGSYGRGKGESSSRKSWGGQEGTFRMGKNNRIYRGRIYEEGKNNHRGREGIGHTPPFWVKEIQSRGREGHRSGSVLEKSRKKFEEEKAL